MSLLKFLIATSLVVSVVYATEKGQAVKKKASETIEAASEYTKEQKEDIQRGLDRNLNAISDEINELKRDAKKSSGKAKDQMNEQIAALEVKRLSVQNDVARLKKSSGKAWDELKAGTSAALDKLSESYGKAKAQFKESKAE